MNCNCNNGTGWIPIDDEYTGDRTWRLCEECNNPQNTPKPMDANCICCNCGGIGWERPNDYEPWMVCSVCENRCNFSRPVEVCQNCNGIGWDYRHNDTNGYIEWFVCPVCNNRNGLIKPPDIPTWPSPAAGGKSRKRKSTRTRKKKSKK